MSAQMDKAGMVEGMTPISAYIQTIPYIVYGWLAVILVPLFVLKVIPLFGPMKEAEKRALETGEVLSKESKEALVELPEEETALAGKKNRALNFLIPMIVVAVLTIITEDILIGIFAAIVACFILYLPQRLMNFTQFFDTVVKGLVDMFPVLLLIIMAYTLMEVNSGGAHKLRYRCGPECSQPRLAARNYLCGNRTAFFCLGELLGPGCHLFPHRSAAGGGPGG